MSSAFRYLLLKTFMALLGVEERENCRPMLFEIRDSAVL